MPNEQPFSIQYTFDLGDLGFHTTDIELCSDVILDGADHFDMIVFDDEKDLKNNLLEYVDEEELLDIILKKYNPNSPYYKEKLMDMLKGSGLG